MDGSKINENGSEDNQVKLYILLVDQLHKYTSVFWQFPLVLLAANSFALDKFIHKPVILFVLAVIDWALLFAFYRLIVRQGEIITATKNAENKLKEKINYKEFIPTFEEKELSSPHVTLCVLIILTVFLTIFSICGFCQTCPIHLEQF